MALDKHKIGLVPKKHHRIDKKIFKKEQVMKPTRRIKNISTRNISNWKQNVDINDRNSNIIIMVKKII